MTFKEWNDIITYAKTKITPISNMLGVNKETGKGFVSVDTETDYKGSHIIRISLFDSCGHLYKTFYSGVCGSAKEYRQRIDYQISLIMKEII